jgi:ferritin-like metal-binding protein YciE
VNRSQKDIEGRKDIKAALAAERKFFLRYEIAFYGALKSKDHSMSNSTAVVYCVAVELKQPRDFTYMHHRLSLHKQNSIADYCKEMTHTCHILSELLEVTPFGLQACLAMHKHV